MLIAIIKENSENVQHKNLRWDESTAQTVRIPRLLFTKRKVPPYLLTFLYNREFVSVNTGYKHSDSMDRWYISSEAVSFEVQFKRGTYRTWFDEFKFSG